MSTCAAGAGERRAGVMPATTIDRAERELAGRAQGDLGRSLGGGGDAEVGGYERSARLGQGQCDGDSFPAVDRLARLKVTDGWLNAEVTPEGRPETLRS